MFFNCEPHGHKVVGVNFIGATENFCVGGTTSSMKGQQGYSTFALSSLYDTQVLYNKKLFNRKYYNNTNDDVLTYVQQCIQSLFQKERCELLHIPNI